MSEGDYPPGAYGDSKAPWKEKEIICPRCDGEGLVTYGSWVHDEPVEEMRTCPLCDGIGYVNEYDPDVQDYLELLNLD